MWGFSPFLLGSVMFFTSYFGCSLAYSLYFFSRSLVKGLWYVSMHAMSQGKLCLKACVGSFLLLWMSRPRSNVRGELGIGNLGPTWLSRYLTRVTQFYAALPVSWGRHYAGPN